MKHTLILFVLTFFLLGPLPGVAAEQGSSISSAVSPMAWSAELAVSYALEQNPDIHIALQRLAEAQAILRSARAAESPSIYLVAEYNQTNTPMYSFGNILNQGTFDNSIDFNDPGRTDNLKLKAELQYRLYNGGRDLAGIESAEAQEGAASERLESVHQQLAFEVVKAYHTIAQSQEMVRVRQAAVEAISSSLAVGKARYEAGDLLKEDLLNLELQQARASEELIRSRHGNELAGSIFLNLLGLQNGEVRIEQRPSKTQVVPATRGYSARPELQVMDSLIRSRQAELERASGGSRPTIDTFAQYQFDAGTVLDASGDSWLAGVRLNYNLYDGNRTEAAIAKSKSQLKGTLAEKARLELALNLEIQQADISYQQALERLQLTEKMVSVAEESARLSRLRFQEGVILASDLIDMEMRLTDAQARRSSAKTEHLIAIANLRRATGAEQFPSVEYKNEQEKQ